MAGYTDDQRGVKRRGLNEEEKARVKDHIQALLLDEDPETTLSIYGLKGFIDKAINMQRIFTDPGTGPESKLAAATCLLSFQRFLLALPPGSSDKPVKLEDLAPFSTRNVLAWSAYKVPSTPAATKPIAQENEQGVVIKLKKTSHMSFSSPAGIKYILFAAVQKLHPELSDHKTLLVVQNIPASYQVNFHDVKGAEGLTFARLDNGAEFPVQISQDFIRVLVKIIATPDDVLQKKAEDRIIASQQIWTPVHENTTPPERMMFALKKIVEARNLYNQNELRYIPGKIYSNNMIFVYYTGTMEDQVWMSGDGRLWAVNERNLMLEAFRQGVLSANGSMTAMTFLALAITTAILLGPAIAAAELPAAAQSLYFTLVSTPFTSLAVAEMGFGIIVKIGESGFKEFLDSLKHPLTALMYLSSLLHIYVARQIDSGYGASGQKPDDPPPATVKPPAPPEAELEPPKPPATKPPPSNPPPAGTTATRGLPSHPPATKPTAAEKGLESSPGKGSRPPTEDPPQDSGDLQAERQQLARLLHKRELGLEPNVDRSGNTIPGLGKYRSAEAELGSALESATGTRMTRTDKATDWKPDDNRPGQPPAKGPTYDGVGIPDNIPPGRFSMAQFIDSIKHHLNKTLDYVVVDITDLSEAQLAELDKFLESLDKISFSRIMKIHRIK